MPKITIKEFDKTKAGSTIYTNFSVALPGYVKQGVRIAADDPDNKTDKNINYGEFDDGTSVFDENGIYECDSQYDFDKYIGLVPSGDETIIAAVAPKVDPNWNIEGSGAPKIIEDEDLFIQSRAGGKLYFVTDRESGADDVGYLKDKNYLYTKVTAEDTWSTSLRYIILSKTGTNAITAGHFGNQIAYELLGLGYTILYKRMDSVLDLKDPEFFKPFTDKAIYDFRYIITGLLTDADGSASANIISVAHFNNNADVTGRGDCVALIDINPSLYEGVTQSTAIKNIAAASASGTFSSKYAALFAPYVTYNMEEKEEFGNNRTFPGYFHYLACAAKAAENYNEWYAVAGYNRGISKYAIESVGCKFGEAAINALEPRHVTSEGVHRAVNLIVKIKKNYFLWGNRTAEDLGDEGSDFGDLRASHFLNIRQLCTTIKKQIYVACRRFTFDPNSDVLWINFKNAIIPTLEKMKADQGIDDYKFIKVATSQKAKLAAKIRIIPIEAVEDFDIDLYLEDSISGVTVGIEE